MDTLKTMLEDQIKQRGLSVREAARQIGIAHTTLIRLIQGSTADMDSLILICNWMGVSIASALNSMGVGKDKLAAQVAMVLEQSPELEQLFSDAFDDLEAGELSPEDIREILTYLVFRVGTKKRESDAKRGVLQAKD